MGIKKLEGAGVLEDIKKTTSISVLGEDLQVRLSAPGGILIAVPWAAVLLEPEVEQARAVFTAGDITEMVARDLKHAIGCGAVDWRGWTILRGLA